MFFGRRRIAKLDPPRALAASLMRTRYSLMECVVCGYEELRTGPGRVTCCECGATVRVSGLYRASDGDPLTYSARGPLLPRARETSGRGSR
jgi:hypothetical protein